MSRYVHLNSAWQLLVPGGNWWQRKFLTSSISHGVQHYFPRLWDTGISDVIFELCVGLLLQNHKNYSGLADPDHA